MCGIITIPKGLTEKGELVIILRSEYEEYLGLKKIIPLVKLSRLEKKVLEEGRKQIQKRQYLTLEDLKNELAA